MPNSYPLVVREGFAPPNNRKSFVRLHTKNSLREDLLRSPWVKHPSFFLRALGLRLWSKRPGLGASTSGAPWGHSSALPACPRLAVSSHAIAPHCLCLKTT